jgi:putative RecB family exonuclease
MTCPLLYRFRVIDKLPEPPSPAAARGTLVHAVLERLFDQPAAERTPEVAHALVQPEWDRLSAAEPELATLFSGPDELAVWLREADAARSGWWTTRPARPRRRTSRRGPCSR